MQFRLYVRLFRVFLRNQPTDFNETLHVPTRGKNTHHCRSRILNLFSERFLLPKNCLISLMSFCPSIKCQHFLCPCIRNVNTFCVHVSKFVNTFCVSVSKYVNTFCVHVSKLSTLFVSVCLNSSNNFPNKNIYRAPFCPRKFSVATTEDIR